MSVPDRRKNAPRRRDSYYKWLTVRVLTPLRPASVDSHMNGAIAERESCAPRSSPTATLLKEQL
jgi:hypothetical protein